jgi:hypothetical protein
MNSAAVIAVKVETAGFVVLGYRGLFIYGPLYQKKGIDGALRSIIT